MNKKRKIGLHESEERKIVPTLEPEEKQRFHRYIGLKNEMCGNLFRQNNNTNLYWNPKDKEHRVSGEVTNSCRDGASCRYRRYTHFMYHTHPNHCKAPPSIDDIVQVNKHNDTIKTMLVVCYWGIFSIHNVNAEIRNEELIRGEVGPILKYIQKLTNNSENYGSQSYNSMKTQIGDEHNNTKYQLFYMAMNDINKLLKSINMLLGFSSWQKVLEEPFILA
jgi:hypothetical protein